MFFDDNINFFVMLIMLVLHSQELQTLYSN